MTRSREGHVKTEAETGAIWLQASDYGQQPQLRQRHGTDPPLQHPEETNPKDTLILYSSL